MKKLLVMLGLAVLMLGLTGCEDYDKQPLEFVNASTYTVTVRSLTTEWGDFALPPGASKKMTGIRDVDYSYYPSTRVKLGFASTDRYIVFVNESADRKSW